jgi:methionyl-tRNA formyltransferase
MAPQSCGTEGLSGGKQMKKRVIIMGKGDLAIRIANWFLESRDYTIAGIVPVIPEPEWASSFLQWVKAKNLNCINSGDYRDINLQNETWAAELVISVFYDRIVKEPFLSSYDCILNLHNGPLPKYRGVSPINWALKNKERKHGVTIHKMTRGIDDGPILAQVEYSIYPEFDEVRSVYQRALEYGWVLFSQTMPILEKIRPMPQDERAASYYGSSQNALLGDRRGFTRQESMNT